MTSNRQNFLKLQFDGLIRKKGNAEMAEKKSPLPFYDFSTSILKVIEVHLFDLLEKFSKGNELFLECNILLIYIVLNSINIYCPR